MNYELGMGSMEEIVYRPEWVRERSVKNGTWRVLTWSSFSPCELYCNNKVSALPI